MITLKNPSAASEWIIDLKEYPQVENSLPMAGLNVRNDSNIVAYVDLDGLKVGEVQRYSADPFQGRNFSLIRIYNPDGQDFAPDDLFIQAMKGEVMGSQPFNPQWDMMFFDLGRFATGTDSRTSLSSTVDMDLIKYWVNLQSGLVVQRRLDVQAHATLLGDYKIEFSPSDILSGAVGIGVPPPPDTTMYKKTIADNSFDWSVTNATMTGYIVDLKLREGNLIKSCTAVQGSDCEKSYNDVVGEFYYGAKSASNAVHDYIIWDLDSVMDITEIVMYLIYGGDTYTSACHIGVSSNGTDWVTIQSYTDNGTYEFKDTTARSIRYIKVYCYFTGTGGAPTLTVKINHCAVYA